MALRPSSQWTATVIKPTSYTTLVCWKAGALTNWATCWIRGTCIFPCNGLIWVYYRKTEMSWLEMSSLECSNFKWGGVVALHYQLLLSYMLEKVWVMWVIPSDSEVYNFSHNMCWVILLGVNLMALMVSSANFRLKIFKNTAKKIYVQYFWYVHEIFVKQLGNSLNST